jgi:hypothetical protein
MKRKPLYLSQQQQTTKTLTTMTLTKNFMRAYWKQELKDRIEQRASYWKIKQAERQLSNY